MINGGDTLDKNKSKKAVEEEKRQNKGRARSATLNLTSNSTSAHLLELLTMSDYEYEVEELTWENGQIAMHSLGGFFPANPDWAHRVDGTDTLESIVHQAALIRHTPPPEKTRRPALLLNSCPGEQAEQCIKMNFGCGDININQEDCKNLVRSACGSARTALEMNHDPTTMTTRASYDPTMSLETGKTLDKGLAGDDSKSENQEGKGDTGNSRRSRRRAAATHNESERRRRDKINQRMKTLQKLVPNASKTDKVSILDDVIEYMKQLQAQVQFMSMLTTTTLPQLMVPPQRQIRASSFPAAAAPAAGVDLGAGSTCLPPIFLVPPLLSPSPPNKEASYIMPDPYTSALLAQSMNMELYNKMAAVTYKQQAKQSTQTTSSSAHSNHAQ